MFRILTLLLCFSAMPATSSSVVFSRDVITIQTVRLPEPPPENESVDVMSADAPTASEAEQQRRNASLGQPIVTNHPFVVTIKNIETADPSWIIAQNNLRQDYGILYLYSEAQNAMIEKTDDRKAYDILFIDSYGSIHAIAKNIVPATLLEPLESNKYTKALLYLNSGATDVYDVQLNDTVQHKLFPKKPNIVSE